MHKGIGFMLFEVGCGEWVLEEKQVGRASYDILFYLATNVHF